ncbi:branched chain amino acid ABC transporter inner membrane protein [Neobacillus bataviensis LMG 21833]|uniref:Branched chain amino acid ABC transporter inner membrane protein n=1 Tax=Neobacillus bataviensis LMG 21833 TaxID=1117379 RepID=K6DGI0_9BACI|nr:branched-chain amino acid ABC transporter permease [Neobacillus bataviensis]EKN71677.1 branched chain amino acid ABC transporter inner membrane protein [Neobacillus bataviensis LMG 21833]
MLQLILDGLIYGSIYALIGFAISTLFMTTGVVNFAIGETITFSMYVGIITMEWFHTSYLITVIEIIVITVIFTVLITKILVMPLLKHGSIISTIGTASMYIIFPILTVGLSTQDHTFPKAPIPKMNLSIISSWDAVIFIVTALIAILLHYFVMKSSWGVGIRAIKSNQSHALSIGISVGKIVMITAILSGFIGGITGLIAAPKLLLTHNLMGTPFMVALIGAVLGGLNNPKGIYFGCLLLGVVQSITGGLFGSISREIIPILIVLVVLVIKPEGLFSSIREKRV